MPRIGRVLELFVEYIRELIRKGVVKAPRKGGRVYRVIEAPAAAALPSREEFEHLRPALERRGFVTNRDIQDALKVSRQQAYRIARVLKDSGLLRAEGRGRGARYAPPGGK